MPLYGLVFTTDNKFPLIVYAHGAAGGGIDLIGYNTFFSQLASYGFVVVAHGSCSDACDVKVETHWTECAGVP